jgi:hypothetical protein
MAIRLCCGRPSTRRRRRCRRISGNCLIDGPAEALAQTVNTQPLMLTAGVAVYRLWLDRGGKLPAVVAGHSLGEYSALVAAGVIAFQDAVPLVRLRATAMQEAVPAGAGAMAAILGLDDEKIAEACRSSRCGWRWRGRRSGQFQRPGADGDRRQQGGGGAGLRRLQGAWREACAVVAGFGAFSLVADPTGSRQAGCPPRRA